MANGLKVISSWLFVPDVSVDAGVSSSTSQILSLSKGDMLSLRILVALSETEIDNEYAILIVFWATNQKVVRLDVSVDNTLFVCLLNALQL